MKRPLLALFAMLAAAGCGSSPAAPSTGLPNGRVDFSGLWQGTVKYTQCTGMRHCFARIGASEPFTVRVRQSGARVRAVFTVALSYAVELNGEVMKDGTLELSGSSPFISSTTPELDLAISVTRFSIRMVGGTDMAGTLSYEMRANHLNSEYAVNPAAAVLGGDIVSATRTDLTVFASTFDGTWRGRFIVRSCEPIGPFCQSYQIDHSGSVEVTLAEDGSQVTGTLKLLGTIPVTGQVSGRSVVLNGETVTSASGGSSLTRITSWNTSIDEFGRMSGTLDYLYAWPVSAPVFGSTARAELWQVVKIP